LLRSGGTLYLSPVNRWGEPVRRVSLRPAIVLALAAALLWPIPNRHGSAARARVQETGPNIVLILSDDQRWDTIWAMPNLQSELVAKGVTFSQSFVTNSLCCPSRASILTGQYSHTTGVYKNSPPNGGFQSFADVSTMATWLHGVGYHTGLVGKYLNNYFPRDGQYIAPGWDRWFALYQKKGTAEAAYYYNYSVSDQGVTKSYGSTDADYSTDVFAGEADDFIRDTDASEPLFLTFTPSAPHEPATPPTRYRDSFSDLPRYHPPNYNETDVSDKPSYIKTLPRLGAKQRTAVDNFRINQYRTLLALDDAIGTIVTALTDTGRLANTMIVFASDNGLTWAEHRWRMSKMVPYEESIRVPLVIRYDPLTSTPWTDDHMVTNIDWAPTFADLAGAVTTSVEGISLMPILEQNVTSWRDTFLIEHEVAGDRVPSYCAARTTDFMFTTYNTGENELYDLTTDPYELVNLASNPAYSATVLDMEQRLQGLCSPVPPGFAFTYDVLAPSIPTGLAGNAISSTEVDLSWLASTDNFAVTGYTVYRDGVSIGTTDGATLSFVDTGVTSGITYTYTVDAFDAAGNHSAQSAGVQVTTP
jgi:arylsulfatase A-like enzyme